MTKKVKEEENDRQLSYLLRVYAAISPTNPNDIPTPPFPDRQWLSNLKNQSDLFDLLILNPPFLVSKTHSKRWKLFFWKRIILTLQNSLRNSLHSDQEEEEEEIDERIFTYYISLLQEETTSIYIYPSTVKLTGQNYPQQLDLNQDPDTELHTYFYGDLNHRNRWSRVTLLENKACIINGTTGLRSWGASVCLANYLILNQKLLQQDYGTVLELGSGTGLLGILAHQLNPNNQVILTDCNQSVLDRLKLNISLNLDQGGLVGKKDSLSVSCLDWNSCLSNSPCSDAQSPKIKDGPLLLIGADVIYDPDLVLGLVLTIKHYLQKSSHPSCSTFQSNQTHSHSQTSSSLALICTIVRNSKTWDLFLHTCRIEGLDIELIGVKDAIKHGSIDQAGIIFAQLLDQSDKNKNDFQLVSLQLKTN